MHLSLLLSVLFSVGQATEPVAPVAKVAMVLASKGNVALARDEKKPERIGAMALLQAGDRITVSKGGEMVLVFLHDGHRERIKPTARATVAAKSCQPPDAVEQIAAAKVPAATLDRLRSLTRDAVGAAGVLRGDEKPYKTVPLYGANVLDPRPKLVWNVDTKAEAYKVELYRGKNPKEIDIALWSATVKESSLTYPETQEPLEFGKEYHWKVKTMKGEDTIVPPIIVSPFKVAQKIDIDLVSNLKPLETSKDPSDWLQAAASYEAYNFYGEALLLYERLAKEFPKEVNCQSALASYYERAGRKDLAAKAKEREQELNGK
jgi:hypothetical protein